MKIVDLACGKAYLTFALYYYLTNKGHDVELIGIDLKQDVIANCQALKEALGYTKMHFIAGSIDDFHAHDVDLVVSLHACDKATDYALAKAVSLDAKAIVVAPCCQHEVAAQLKSKTFKYGLLKERFGALLTDALRAELLEQYGYSCDILEFVDPEHTPKNLLIRATKNKTPTLDFTQYDKVCDEFGISPCLKTLLAREV